MPNFISKLITGRLQRKMRRQTLTQVVENTPDISTHEMVWYKNPGREFEIPADLHRRKNGVLHRESFFTKKMHIHTHPEQKGLPSPIDIMSFITAREKTSIIVAVSPEGKVVGRTILVKTKEFKLRVAELFIKDLVDKLSILQDGYDKHKYRDAYYLIESFLIDVGIKIKYAPKSGYRYDIDSRKYVEK